MPTIGVLLVNLGTPDSPSTPDVRKYLNEFLTDGRVIDVPWLQRQLLVRAFITPFRAANSAKSYREIWNEKGSPLKYYGQELAILVQKNLDKEQTGKYKVELAMRYQSPDIKSGLDNLRKAGVSRYIILPLFPQYASASTGSVFQLVMETISRWQNIPDIRFIQSYYNHTGFIGAFAEIGKQYEPNAYDHILFSFHGLPQRQLIKGDDHAHCQQKKDCCHSIGTHNQSCYGAQCYATAHALAEALHIPKEKYTICFQSRLGKDPWVEPYTSEVLKTLAAEGKKRLLVFCPAFVADCLETIFEVSVEYHEEFVHLGGEKVQLVESLNTHPLWVKVLCDMIYEA